MPKKPERITVTRAARTFADVVNRAYYRAERFVLTKGGKAVAALGPVAERRSVTAAVLAERLDAMPHLTPEDAEAFAADLAKARAMSPLDRESSAWD